MKDYSNYYPSIKDSILNDAKLIFDIQLDSEGQEIKLQNKIVRAIVRNHGNPTNEFKEERFLISDKSIDVQRGHIVNYIDEDYIIVTDIDKDNPVYNTCKLLKTTHVLNWLNSDGDICSSPVAIENTAKSSDGIFENTKIKVGDTKVLVIFSENETTNEIRIGQRFLLDKTHAYEVTDTGVASPKGLKYMVMTQTEIHREVDNLKLLIADYYNNEHDYRIEVINKNIILTANDIYKLQVNVYDKNIKLNNPELTFEAIDEDIISITSNTIIGLKEGKTTISVKFKDIMEDIKIQIVKEETDNYTCEIIGKDTMAIDRTRDYVAKFYNNGVEIVDIATWNITDENGKTTDYAKIINSGTNKCTIQTTKNWIFNDNTNKYFYLHCIGTTGKKNMKKIKITSY